MKSPISPKACNPPKIPTKASRNGRRAAPPTRVGQTKWSPISITAAPKPNTQPAASALPPCTSSTRAAIVKAAHAPNGTMANEIVSTVNSSVLGTPASQ